MRLRTNLVIATLLLSGCLDDCDFSVDGTFNQQEASVVNLTNCSDDAVLVYRSNSDGTPCPWDDVTLAADLSVLGTGKQNGNCDEDTAPTLPVYLNSSSSSILVRNKVGNCTPGACGNCLVEATLPFTYNANAGALGRVLR